MLMFRLDRILLRVPQLDSAGAFYRDTFGLTVAKQQKNLASLKLSDHEAELVLHTDPDLPTDVAYYLVDDVRDLYRRREQLRLKFNAPPSPAARGFRATIKDPFGNVLLLIDRSTDSSSS